MAYGKRGFSSASRSKKRRVNPFKRTRKIPRGPAVRQYRAQNGADKLFVKCQRLEHQDVAALPATTTVYQGACQIHELKNIWKFHRYASLYSYFRIHKMKVTFSATKGILTAATCVDADHDSLATDISQVMMNRTSRVHNLNLEGVHSRTFNLQQVAKFRDYISCEGANTLLQETAYKAAIRYAFPGLSHKANQHLTVCCEYVVEFCGFRDIISKDNINASTMGTAVGPEDPPPAGIYDYGNP